MKNIIGALAHVRTLLLSLIIAGLLGNGSLNAQEVDVEQEDTPAAAERTSDNGEQAQEDEKQEEKQEENARSGQRAGSDRFIPSEGISEDLSVSFPVDI